MKLYAIIRRSGWRLDSSDGAISAWRSAAARSGRTSVGGHSTEEMPRVSAFYGIVITMYWRDHPPPHFHATYSGHKGVIGIEFMELIEGWLPPRALRLITEWAAAHRDELQANWERARLHQPLAGIDPLP